MKRLLVIGFIWSIVINIGFVFHVTHIKEAPHRYNEFDVDFNITIDELKGMGFKPFENEKVLSKMIDGMLVQYTVVEGRGVYTKSLIQMDAGIDSVEVATWLQSKGGFICSPLWILENGQKKFFVKGMASGVVFTAFLKGRTFVANVDFPNTTQLNRYENRELRSNGEVIIYEGPGTDEVAIERNDAIGF